VTAPRITRTGADHWQSRPTQPDYARHHAHGPLEPMTSREYARLKRQTVWLALLIAGVFCAVVLACVAGGVA
jgi:hypothetical protein